MDALQSLDGINLGRANITKAEIYLKATAAATLNETQARTLLEDTFGYGLRTFARVRGDWEEFK